MPEEIGAGAPDVTSTSAATSGSTPAGSSPAQAATDTSSADVTAQQSVQGATQQTQETDPLAGIPSIEDAQKLETVSKEAFLRLRGEYDKVAPQFKEIQPKWQSYEPIVSRFDQPEQLQESLDIYDSLIGWTQGPNGLEPATETGAQKLAERFPLHADYLSADLLNMESVDPETGQRMPRIDIALKGMAQDPAERAKVAKMFGLVEPSSISPQWQPTAEELANVKPELQDIYKKLSYEEREELKLASPEFVNSHLQKEKLMQELQTEREQTQQREQQRIQQREAYIRQQADSAGEKYVETQLTDRLATFHNNVVAECDFIKPLDPANLPEGVTAEQAAQFNQQADETNKAEAAQVTLAVIGMVNPQTRPFVLPLLKQIGAIDDATVKAIEEASEKFGNNGRNYGHLEYKGKMSSNGNGYQPDASVTALKNSADNGLKLLIHTANQIKKNLIEKKSQTFQMKANGYNATLNNVAASRPSPNGTTFNPATATGTQLPVGPMTRKEIDALYG